MSKTGLSTFTLSAVAKSGKVEAAQNAIVVSSKGHGKTWDYLGILTSKEAAVNLGYNELTSSSMAEENGRLFLLLSPVKKILFPPHLEYNGVYAFEFVALVDRKPNHCPLACGFGYMALAMAAAIGSRTIALWLIGGQTIALWLIESQTTALRLEDIDKARLKRDAG